MKAARTRRRVKDLKGKKLTVRQQSVVRGGNTFLVGEASPQLTPTKRRNGQAAP